MTKEWITVLRAADAAARWHVHQRRKGAAEEPYVNHLLEVATLVAEATDGKDPELVIAALSTRWTLIRSPRRRARLPLAAVQAQSILRPGGAAAPLGDPVRNYHVLTVT
jgi:hypothetical protein